MQYIFISHGHGDHYGDADLIGKANDALVISTAEVAHKAEEAGLKAHAMHLGGKHDFEFGSIRLTPAFTVPVFRAVMQQALSLLSTIKHSTLPAIRLSSAICST